MVAVKQMDKDRMARQGLRREHVEREVAMMRACCHENITQLYDTFEDSSCIFLALEYCEGGDFGDKVRERGLNIWESEAAAWVQQMCSAIAFLHSKRICHRDIKPDNFMVSEGLWAAKDSGSLKLADFGLAVFLPPGQALSEKCGTPAFMAPEQHLLPRKSRGYGFPIDVWAAGISMYQMICGGRHPFMNDKGTSLELRLLLRGELDFGKADSQKAWPDPDRGLSSGSDRGLRFSDEARDLCCRMVDRDAARRPSARDVVGSSWCNGGQPSFLKRASTSLTSERAMVGAACGFGGVPARSPPGGTVAGGWRAPLAAWPHDHRALRARSEEFPHTRTRSFTTDDVPDFMAQNRSAPPAPGPWVQRAFESVFQPPAFLAELTSCGSCGLQASRSFVSEAPSSPCRASSSPQRSRAQRERGVAGGFRQLSLQPNDPVNPRSSGLPDKVQQAVFRSGHYLHAESTCRKDAGPTVLNEALVAVPSAGSRH